MPVWPLQWPSRIELRLEATYNQLFSLFHSLSPLSLPLALYPELSFFRARYLLVVAFKFNVTQLRDRIAPDARHTESQREREAPSVAKTAGESENTEI